MRETYLGEESLVGLGRIVRGKICSNQQEFRVIGQLDIMIRGRSF